MADDFDAIVVGAGMAGAPAAIRLARAGVNTLLLERGAEPGVKNLSGGVLWGNDLERVVPGFATKMPLERHIVRKRFGVLTESGALSVVHDDAAWRRPPYAAHAVLRARTDAYLAKAAEEAGATVVTSVPVDRLNWEGERVHGVVQGGETMTAPVVLVCDGANSRVSLGTPIRPSSRLRADATELGIKEVFRLDAATIEERFQLSAGEGHAEEWVAGFLPPGVMGGGFLYTNTDTVSLGLILNVGSLLGPGAYAHDLMERFKLHPAIAPRLAGAELVEYGAKLISSGWASRPASFHGAGWLVCGDAAGLVYSNGVVIQGMNYAVRSGWEAAETVIAARSRGDYSAASLSEYTSRLERTGILGDFREAEGLDRVKGNERLYGAYPALAETLAASLQRADGASPVAVVREARRAMKRLKIRPSDAVHDAAELWRAA